MTPKQGVPAARVARITKALHPFVRDGATYRDVLEVLLDFDPFNPEARLLVLTALFPKAPT